MPSIDTAAAQESAVVREGKKVSEPAESAVPDAKSAVADQSPVNDEAAADSSVEVADTSAEVVAPVEEVVTEEVIAKSDDDEESTEAKAIDPEMIALYAEFNALKRKRGQPRGPPSRPNQSSSDKRRKLDATGRTLSTATSASTQSKTPSSSTPKAGGSTQSTTKKPSNQKGDAKAAKKK